MALLRIIDGPTGATVRSISIGSYMSLDKRRCAFCGIGETQAPQTGPRKIRLIAADTGKCVCCACVAAMATALSYDGGAA